jgi:cell division septation protein DedD
MFFKTGMDEGRTGQMKRVILLPGKDAGRTAALVGNLIREGIEVTVAREGFKSSSAHDYLGSKPSAKEFPAGAYIIDFNQPQKRLAKAHLEPNSELDQEFIRRELARRERNEQRGKNVDKEGYEFYDITSWSLPLAAGVEAYWTEDSPQVRGSQVTLKEESAPLRHWNALDVSGLAAADGQPLAGLGGGVEGGRAQAAYIIPYGADAASRLAIALLGEGFKLAVATRQLNAIGRNWPAGTLIARTSRNGESLHDRISALARETGAQVYAANSSFPEEGDTGIGSESIVSLKSPRVAVVWDEGTSPTGFGAMWYSFERAYGLKFTPLSINALKAVDLQKFNVIIFPDGSGGAYQSALGKPGIDKLKEWVNRGGTLIGIGGGATMMARKDVELSSSRIVGSDEDTPTPTEKPQEETKPAEQKEKPKEAKPEEKPAKKKPVQPINLPGSSFRAKINRDHFLSYGYASDSLVVLFGGDTFFRPSKDGANVVTFAADGALTVAGFVWPDNTEELLRGTAYLIDEPVGGGHVILFADDPNFRHLWRTSTQLFFNSILLAPSLR